MSASKPDIDLKPWQEIGEDGSIQLKRLDSLIGSTFNSNHSSGKKSFKKKKIPLQRLTLTAEDFLDSKDGPTKNRTVRKELFKVPLPSVSSMVQQNEITRKSSKRRDVGKSTFTLQPLMLTPADFDSPNLRNSVTSNKSKARKGVYKIPSKSALNVHRLSLNRENSTKKTIYNNGKPSPANKLPSKSKVKKALFTEGSTSNKRPPRDRDSSAPVRLSKIPEVIKKSKLPKPRYETKKATEERKIPTSNQKNENKFCLRKIEHPRISDLKHISNKNNSSEEFLEIEELCFEVSQKTGNVNCTNNYTILNEIKCVLEKTRIQQQENYNKILKSLSKLEKCTCNKENFAEARLNKKKSSLEPATENLENRTLKKAVDMYNNFRKDCTILCTPKLNNRIDSPVSIKRTLSRKIQDQCLMLLDTPRH